MEQENNVKKYVKDFYHDPDPTVREEAARWLQDFQITSAAWKVAEKMLLDCDIETSLFCSHTLGIQVDKQSLDAILRLRDSLTTLFKKLQEIPTPSRTQISLSLAGLASHVLSWLARQMDVHPEYVQGFLELLTLLPEAFNYGIAAHAGQHIHSLEATVRYPKNSQGQDMEFMQTRNGGLFSLASTCLRHFPHIFLFNSEVLPRLVDCSIMGMHSRESLEFLMYLIELEKHEKKMSILNLKYRVLTPFLPVLMEKLISLEGGDLEFRILLALKSAYKDMAVDQFRTALRNIAPLEMGKQGDLVAAYKDAGNVGSLSALYGRFM